MGPSIQARAARVSRDFSGDSDKPTPKAADLSSISGAVELKSTGADWSQLPARTKLRMLFPAIVVVLLIAIGALVMREIKKSPDTTTAEVSSRALTSEDVCHSAVGTLMMAYLANSGTDLDPNVAASVIFGPATRRAATVEDANKIGDETDSLRNYVESNETAQEFLRLWLDAISTQISTTTEVNERRHVQSLLLNKCLYG